MGLPPRLSFNAEGMWFCFLTREGLMVCAGDSGHAFKFAPVLGALIADVLEQRPNRLPRRFSWRELEGDTSPASGISPTPRK